SRPMLSRIAPYVFVLLVIGSGLLIHGCSGCNHGKEAVKDSVDTVKGADNILIKSLTAKIHADPANPENYFNRSKVYLQNNNIKGAYWDMQKAMKLDSGQAKYYFQLTDIFMKGGYADGAIDVLKKLLRRDLENTEAMNKLSKVYFYQKDYDNSLKQLT